MANKAKGVLVTTANNGVFFGYQSQPQKDATVILKNARNCVYWPSELKGFLGLATTGPVDGCRIGPAAPTLTLNNVTSIAGCTPQAIAAWEKAPWQL